MRTRMANTSINGEITIAPGMVRIRSKIRLERGMPLGMQGIIACGQPFDNQPAAWYIFRPRPHCLVAQDVALSRPKLGFESRWGHCKIRRTGGFLICGPPSHHRGAGGQNWGSIAKHAEAPLGGTMKTTCNRSFLIIWPSFTPSRCRRPKQGFDREANRYVCRRYKFQWQYIYRCFTHG